MKSCSISIPISDNAATTLRIFSERVDIQTIFETSDHERHLYNEAAVQLLEGCSYEFKLDGKYELQEISKVIFTSKVNATCGRIVPGNYVGTLVIAVLEQGSRRRVASVPLEVRSAKLSYREDYRIMLEEISEHATELLMQHSSPVTQTFTHLHSRDATTLYQRFAFVKTIVASDEFQSALNRVVHSPVTGWQQESQATPFQAVRRVDRSTARQITTAKARTPLPDQHPLRHRVSSLPAHLSTRVKTASVDTPENRFVKHALENFFVFCEEIGRIGTALNYPQLASEAIALAEDLQSTLLHPLFYDISPLTTVPLNNPVLQRKEGYREVLHAWLLFDVAAQLVWSGGDDVYSAGKRDVAVLYEYWVFFKLLEILKRVFNLSLSHDQLLETTPYGLGLKLKQGRQLAMSGMFDHAARRLNIEFNYNKSFPGGSEYPKGGSWTKSFRPDYTLSLWPEGISSEQAEIEELIIHIHFDAKYKLDSIDSILGATETNQVDEDSPNYQRADLLKMHAYRDAIRRTAGAYILYPGESDEVKRGFHEILPGLGAFAIRPTGSDTGEASLEAFLREISHHLLNRASNRERLSYRTHQIHSRAPSTPVVANLPEPIGSNRALLPSETFVLVGYFKDQSHLEWIHRSSKYNVRSGSARGAMHMTPDLTAARYLLLHTAGDTHSKRLFRLSPFGPRLAYRKELEESGYPTPHHDFYLLFDILTETETELGVYSWRFRSLPGYSDDREGFPFTVTLEELMQVSVLP